MREGRKKNSLHGPTGDYFSANKTCRHLTKTSRSVFVHRSNGEEASTTSNNESTSGPRKYSFLGSNTQYFCVFVMRALLILLMAAASGVHCSYSDIDKVSHDVYHYLHLPHDPPLYPTFYRLPYTGFSCSGRDDQLWSDLATGCQGYHLCQNQRLIASNLCVNGTLFNQQFQVCDQFYNVRCGSAYEDL